MKDFNLIPTFNPKQYKVLKSFINTINQKTFKILWKFYGRSDVFYEEELKENFHQIMKSLQFYLVSIKKENTQNINFFIKVGRQLNFDKLYSVLQIDLKSFYL